MAFPIKICSICSEEFELKPDKPGFAKADAGHICLQDHGNEVAFRNIKIRILPTKE